RVMRRAAVLFFLARDCCANPGHGGPLGHLHNWGWEHALFALLVAAVAAFAVWKSGRPSMRKAMHAMLAALTPITATAQQPVQDDALTVTGRYSNNVGEWDAASQGAVTQESISKRPLLRSGEVLESVPGMI